MANLPSNVIPFPRPYRPPPRQPSRPVATKRKSKLNYLERECVRRHLERMGVTPSKR